MSALVQCRLSPATAHEAMTTGRRYGGVEALAAGIVSAALPLDELVPYATEWARSQAPKAGPTLRTIRTTMYREAIDLLGQPVVLDIPMGT
jgi:enoyl-CoA hydratase/carnithine racemase